MGGCIICNKPWQMSFSNDFLSKTGYTICLCALCVLIMCKQFLWVNFRFSLNYPQTRDCWKLMTYTCENGFRFKNVHIYLPPFGFPSRALGMAFLKFNWRCWVGVKRTLFTSADRLCSVIVSTGESAWTSREICTVAVVLISYLNTLTYDGIAV